MHMIRVIPIVNAGVVLYLGGKTIWADVLNEASPDGYEALSAEMLERLLRDPAFRPDLILFTHRHPDHFSENALKKALAVYPEAHCVIGGGEEALPHTHTAYDTPALKLTAIPLPHEGRDYAGVQNDALLISAAEGTVLIPGDCPPACPELLDELDRIRSEKPDFRVDLALLNFPWLSLGKGRKGLSHMDPGHVLFFHFPALQDDRYGYLPQAMRMQALYGKGKDWRIRKEVFSEELFEG